MRGRYYRPPVRLALLSTWLVGAAVVACADGPVVVPDDRAVNFTVGDTAKPDETATPETGATVAPMPAERLPLGEAVKTNHKAGPEPAADHRGAVEIARGEAVRVGLPLLGVIALMIVLGAAVRRFAGPLAGGGRPSGVLEVLGRYPIARGQQLLLMRMVSRVVLLHQSRNGLTTLSEVAEPAEVAALLARVEAATRSGQTGRFQGLLASAADATDGKVVVDLTRRPAHRLGRSAGA